MHSVVFSAQAEDADGDTLMYVIDTASVSGGGGGGEGGPGPSAGLTDPPRPQPDARFFRIDLPNSGRVVLARPLDFESRRHLEVVVTAVVRPPPARGPSVCPPVSVGPSPVAL